MTGALTFTVGDGCRIAYRFDGAAGKPVLVLSNSIGTGLAMWDGQIAALSAHFRVLRYDLRGHGGSDVPAGPYSMERLGRDVIELLDALGIARAHFCGLSLGGMVGQWLGIHAPQRIERLILCHTAPWLAPAEVMDERIAAVLRADRAETAAQFLGNWFPPRLLHSAAAEPFRAMLLAAAPQGIAGCLGAVRDMDFRGELARIPKPVLVIAGRYDTVTLASHSEQIAAAVPGAALLVLPAVHLSNIECPAAFLDAVLGFLLRQ